MKRKKSNMPIFMGIAAFALVLGIVINVSIPKKVNYEEMSEEELQVAIQDKVDQIENGNLSGMGERDRMEYYLKSFIDEVEASNYEKAYEMLYEEFKNNYFPTLEDFEKYAKKTFPKMSDISYTNFERNGDIYVLWVTISDSLAGKDSAVEMNFVIQEYDLNDFVLSFSV